MSHRRLPEERKGTTHRFAIGDPESQSYAKGYVTVNMHDDGTPGELFITVSKSGSAEHGLYNVIGILASMALQAGVPISEIAAKLKGLAFDPDGWTKIAGKPYFAKSVCDHIGRWLEHRFVSDGSEVEEGHA